MKNRLSLEKAENKGGFFIIKIVVKAIFSMFL